MKEAREAAASVPIQSGLALWVTGGWISDGSVSKTTEIVHADGSIEDGPDLPFWFHLHCMAKLDTDRYALTGEYTSEFGEDPEERINVVGRDWSNVYIYEEKTEIWDEVTM